MHDPWSPPPRRRSGCFGVGCAVGCALLLLVLSFALSAGVLLMPNHPTSHPRHGGN